MSLLIDYKNDIIKERIETAHRETANWIFTAIENIEYLIFGKAINKNAKAITEKNRIFTNGDAVGIVTVRANKGKLPVDQFWETQYFEKEEITGEYERIRKWICFVKNSTSEDESIFSDGENVFSLTDKIYSKLKSLGIDSNSVSRQRILEKFSIHFNIDANSNMKNIEIKRIWYFTLAFFKKKEENYPIY